MTNTRRSRGSPEQTTQLASGYRQNARLALRGGGTVTIAGPDGVGKTTLCDRLVEEVLAGVPVLRIRFPGVLPRRTVHTEPVTEPHRDPADPALVSLGKTLYWFVDFLLGWAVKVRPFVRKGGWVVSERGWWDLAVDPRRYRLIRAARTLVQLLGPLLPPFDLVLVLEAPPDVVMARKAELPLDELHRQMQEWRRLSRGARRRVYLDASAPIEEVVRRASEELQRVSADRDAARAGSGYVTLPSPRRPRFTLPRAPRGALRSALGIYQPVTVRGRAAWEMARALAWVGAGRLFPRGQLPPHAVRTALAAHLLRGESLATARSRHIGRWVALVLTPAGRVRAVAKVATDQSGQSALDREADAVTTLARDLPEPLKGPTLILRQPGVLMFEPVPWQPRWRPWRLSEEVAAALGTFHGSSGSGTPGPGHGDFAPWNLLKVRGGWILIDWEEATDTAMPFFDILHYLVQGHALLGRPSRHALIRGLDGEGWVGRALKAYARAAGLDETGIRPALEAYLRETLGGQDRSRTDGRRGAAVRTRLLAHLSGQR